MPGANEPVLPEKSYPIGSSIYIDLYNVLRANTNCGRAEVIYHSYIAFQGIKRYPAASTYQQALPASGRFRRQPQTYAYPLTIDWPHFDISGAVNPPRQFNLRNSNFDFELLGIRISQPNVAHPLLTNDMMLTIYDRHQYATSSLPVPQAYLNSARATAQTAPPYRSAFPCPPLIYPVGSQILFEVTSMLCTALVPQDYVIDFVGCWRLPR